MISSIKSDPKYGYVVFRVEIAKIKKLLRTIKRLTNADTLEIAMQVIWHCSVVNEDKQLYDDLKFLVNILRISKDGNIKNGMKDGATLDFDELYRKIPIPGKKKQNQSD